MDKLKINIVLVDDNILNAQKLEMAVESYQSELAIYHVKTFSRVNAFQEAKRYILSNQQEIGLLLVDYNLNGNYGTDLFKLVDNARYRIYKILHSITDASIRYTKEELRDKQYDDFCYSKDKDDIQSALSAFENSILNVMLYGNKNFRSKYFNESTNRIGSIESQKISTKSTIIFFDVLYVESLKNERIAIHYRDLVSGEIHTATSTSSTLKEFKELNPNFKSVNSHLIVNLLWVAYIDTNVLEIIFVMTNNSVQHLKYVPTALFDQEIRPSLPKISEHIPTYFYSEVFR